MFTISGDIYLDICECCAALGSLEAVLHSMIMMVSTCPVVFTNLLQVLSTHGKQLVALKPYVDFECPWTDVSTDCDIW